MSASDHLRTDRVTLMYFCLERKAVNVGTRGSKYSSCRENLPRVQAQPTTGGHAVPAKPWPQSTCRQKMAAETS